MANLLTLCAIVKKKKEKKETKLPTKQYILMISSNYQVMCSIRALGVNTVHTKHHHIK